MRVDYDLIILGGAAVGRYAALRACQLGARVALIEPTASAAALPDCFSQINRSLRSRARIGAAGVPALPDWPQLRQWAEQVSQRLTTSAALSDSLPHLMTAGVEVILAEAAFCPPPNPRLRFALSVGERVLRARAYLLAPGLSSALPEGLSQARPWTDGSSLPARIVILGDHPQRIWQAQVLNRLGAEVTLIGGAFLPQADPDAERLLQLQLEAEGVTVLTQVQAHTAVQVEQLDSSKIQVQAGNWAIEAEAILLAGSELALASLNLEAAGVRYQPDRILVNRRLQTTQPRIYACHSGEFAGGLAEADLALHNALGLPARQLSAPRIYSLPTDPEVVRLGLTEPQALQRYGSAVQIGSLPLKHSASAQLRGELTGFVKLVAHSNGSILGAHAVGAGASDWMGEVALAMQQRLKLKDLAAGSPLSPMSGLIRQVAAQIQTQQRPNWQRELLEAWFDLRRGR